MFKKGDKISVLDEELEGVVISEKDNLVEIETPEGFILKFHQNELVKIGSSFSENISVEPEVISEKVKEENYKKRKKRPKNKPKERDQPPLEVDLHIEKLTASHKRMDAYDILNLQLDTVKRQLNFAMNKRIRKVVFIHGVGEGVLKSEIQFLLGRYENLKFYDADYQKYGMGATEVYIFQNSTS